MILSKRMYYRRLYKVMMVIGVFISVGIPIANQYVFHIDIINTACRYLFIFLLTVVMLVFVISMIKYRGIKGYYLNTKLIDSLETNLIAIGAYTQPENKSFAVLPVIRTKGNTIRIRMDNLKIRTAIEKYLDSFSTALPEKYVVEDYYISQNGMEVVIEYEDLKSYIPENYTISNYLRKVQSIAPQEIYFDKKHIVDISDYPHWLISGSSGSGKSYLTNELLIQAVVKNWKIVVCDLKRSYGIYRRYIDYAYEPEDILIKLQEVETEMQQRLEKMQSQLDINPCTLAADVGYKPMMVIIEEYISLQASLSKKDKEELERVVKNISVMARQASIHLIMVLQSAGTENINATTRSNLAKVLLGNAQSNIKSATFGTGVDIPYHNCKLGKGEGLIQLERITLLRVPQINDLDMFNDAIGVLRKE